jgi:hypothetical protein
MTVPMAQTGPPAPQEAGSAEKPGAGESPLSDMTASAAKAQAEGTAVVEQILKDKEDLIAGKRFTYDPGGRRDPFRSLLEQISGIKGPRPKGIAGMLIAEVDLVGTVKQNGGDVAFFRGSDNKGYFLKVGDELYDGRLIGIDPVTGAVTFRQRVDDPRQIKPYRDIVKRLTPGNEEEAQ